MRALKEKHISQSSSGEASKQPALFQGIEAENYIESGGIA